MGLRICDQCGQPSVIKTPHCRVTREGVGHIRDDHSMDCLNPSCNYTSGKIRVNTKLGDTMELPWYKRIFKF